MAGGNPQKLWAPTATGPFLAAHLKSLQDFPPSQGADTLSMKKAVEGPMRKLDEGRGLVWIERTPSGEIRYTTDPETSWWLRIKVDLLSILPIEWLL